MSEELLQRDLIKNPEKIGSWDFYNIGATSVKSLKEAGIIRSIDYKNVSRKKVDGIVVSHKNVIAIIENKLPKNFNTAAKKRKAIQQSMEVAKKLKSNLIIATDTQETIWVNVLTGNYVKDEEGQRIKYLFDPKDVDMQKKITVIIESLSEKNDKIMPKKLVNPTGLAKQIWQDIWAVSGATPENCLYTFIELFIFKYLSDLGILASDHSFDKLLGKYEYMPEEEVLDHYAQIIRRKIKLLFPESKEDKTTIINGTIFVSKDQSAIAGYSGVFRKILERFRDYGKLENIDYDFKSKLFESFLKESISKKNWGQFFTPMKVIQAVTEMAGDDIFDGMKICDPACGVGKFPLEFVRKRINKLFLVKNNKIIPKVEITGFDKGFDRDEQKTIILAKANMMIYFSELVKEHTKLTKKFADLFNKTFTLKTNSILGTLANPIEGEYDLILTNPPYVTSGTGNLKDEIKKNSELSNYYKISAVGAEGLFMEWVVKALKPNGRAFIIVPDGIFNRQNDKTLREFIIDECFIDGIISLPLNTFFTTNKKTYILAITKKTNKKERQKTPVFTYLVSEIGESRDINRFDIEQNDLQEAVSLYSFFKGNKKEFQKINTDNRCKIQPFDKFMEEISNGWTIDKWWGESEKIKLGIVQQKEIISPLEFAALIGDISTLANGCQAEIKEFFENKLNVLNKNIKLVSIKDFCDLPANGGSNKLNKSFINKNLGDIPVYGGKKNGEPVGYIKNDLPGINYFKDTLAWNREGSVGYVFYHKHLFATNDHHRPIEIKSKYLNDLDPEYLRYAIEKALLSQGFKWSQTASKIKVANTLVEIPVTKDGFFDLQEQREMVEKYYKIEEIKYKIREYKKAINSLIIDIKSQDTSYKEISIGELFEFPATNSKITKEFCVKNRGDIPVYASSKSEKSVLGYIKHNIRNINYYKNCLSWNRNGSVGYVFIRNHVFATNEDHRAMIVKNDFIDKIFKGYLKYEIEKKLFEAGFSFVDKCGVEKIKKVLVSIPTNGAGDFDLQKQKEISEKYYKIEEIKGHLTKELEKIESTEVELASSSSQAVQASLD